MPHKHEKSQNTAIFSIRVRFVVSRQKLAIQIGQNRAKHCSPDSPTVGKTISAMAPLSCTHKNGRCLVCLECKRCGCDHDGVPVAVKMARKRGQHGPPKNVPESKRPRRSCVDYEDGDLFESPLKIEPIPPQKGKYSLPVPLPQPPPTFTALEKPGDVLKLLGDSPEAVESWYGHAAAAEIRQDPSSWIGELDQSKRLVVKTAIRAAREVCVALCGGEEEAGAALWGRIASTGGGLRDSEQVTLLETIARCYQLAKKGSTEKRVLRASLSCAPRDTIPQLREVVPVLTLAPGSFLRAREDLEKLCSGLSLDRTPRTLQRLRPSVIDAVLSSIFCPDKVSFLSWGVKNVRINGVTVVLPAIMRRRNRASLFESYQHESLISHPNDGTVSASTFYRIASAVTAGDAQERRAVDYVVGFLVNDQFDVLKYIVEQTITDPSVKEKLLVEMEFNAAYLKYGFDARIKAAERRCALHDIKFALSVTAEHTTTDICADCTSILRFYTRLKTHLVAAEAHPSALTVIDDCAQKSKLFVGHRLRVVNQQQTIAQIVAGMKEQCTQQGSSDEALVIVDFKMKLEPLYHREKTVDHYGKRGVSWHGALVQYFVLDLESQTAVDQRLYYDHLSMADTKQDKEAVASVIEAIVMRLKVDLPHIKMIVFQSDNATSYQNTFIPLLLPLVSAIHGIQVTRFVHTETQDGKSILDAHFARAMQLLLAWVREGNDCRTPTQAVVGLTSRGGLRNCVVELVTHDRVALQKLTKAVEVIEKTVRRYVKRANDIQFDLLQGELLGLVTDGYAACPPFTMTVHEYSSMGSGQTLLITPSEQSVVVVPSGSDQGLDSPLDNTSDDIHAPEDSPGSNDHDDIDPDNVDEYLEDMIDEGERIDGGEIDIEELPVTTNNVIDPAVCFGPLTGVKIATQGQIRQRTRRWKRPPEAPTTIGSSDSDISARDAVSYAVLRTLEMQRIGDLTVRDPRTASLVTEDIGDSIATHGFKSGWGMRMKKGSMYGRRYAAEFRAELYDLFLQGERRQSDKLGPGRMLEILQHHHPDRYDLPSENEIRQEIAKFRMSGKPRAPILNVPGTSVDQSSMRPRAADAFFESLLDLDLNAKPKHALAVYRTTYGEGGLSDKQLKAKFSSLKNRRKDVS